MIEILAEGVIGTPEAVLGGIVLALLGWVGNSGYSIILTKRDWARANGGGTGKPSAPDWDDCNRRHDAEAKLRSVENAAIVKSIDQMSITVTKLHDRFDEYLRKE